MKFFVDTADVDEIADLADSGLLDGVTTNPSLVAKTGRGFVEVLREICGLVEGPVSAEVTATRFDDMMREGHRLAEVAPNIAVKLPLLWDGLKACRKLADDGIKVNVTLCFSPAQALLAAKAGATFVSPFVGRLDDVGHDGMALIADICEIYRQYPETLRTEVLVASTRHPGHIVEAARLGAHVVTMPPKVLRQLAQHPLTDKGLAAFLKDWEATGQTIARLTAVAPAAKPAASGGVRPAARLVPIIVGLSPAAESFLAPLGVHLARPLTRGRRLPALNLLVVDCSPVFVDRRGIHGGAAGGSPRQVPDRRRAVGGRLRRGARVPRR